MNRLVIIGNGFDLAHGLPTSYGHFIDDFWKNFKTNCKSEEYTKLITTHDSYNNYYLYYRPIENFNDFKSNLIDYCKDNSYKYIEDKLIAITSSAVERKTIFEFKSNFFKIINIKNSQNWVDIENEYYYQLKKIIKSESLDVSKSKEYWSNEQKNQVEKLNKEFQQVKNLLEKYLFEKVFKVYNFYEYNDLAGNMFKFPHLFKPITYKDDLEEMKRFLDEFPKPDQGNVKNQFIFRGDDLIADCKITFLSFNYTPTLWNYSNILKGWDVSNEVIYIHGSLNDSANVINFGFGDEMDDDYKMIENINDNEYLRNFKSFLYLQNSNYKNLLDFVESEKFQVFIMGHSCGLSDRTMLNTIFEHPNCISIKVFYHEIKDENGKVIKDNYTEIIQNISRHFNKKKLMREKIVNKTLCQPLPQIKLPRKE